MLQEIAAATGDDYRLVRVRAAAALAQFPNMRPQGKMKGQVDKATEEYLASLMARPDSWDAHYNLGNYYLGQNRPKEALAEYDEAVKREPQAILALVNAAMAHARLGETAKAEEKLNEALKITPDSAAARYNLGLIKAEQGDLPAAEQNLKAAFKADPQMAGAAYNLCVITAKDRPAEALEWCRKAASAPPPGAQVRLDPGLLPAARGGTPPGPSPPSIPSSTGRPPTRTPTCSWRTSTNSRGRRTRPRRSATGRWRRRECPSGPGRTSRSGWKPYRVRIRPRRQSRQEALRKDAKIPEMM